MTGTPNQLDPPPAGAVIIIGGGLAGLSCAKRLSAAGQPIVLLESSDRVGGRVRTEVIDGLKLDHGFQVLLTAYPACRELLDYDALRLRPFEPGTLVRKAGRFAKLGDPWRRPGQALSTAFSPVGTITDKLRVFKTRRAALRGTLAELYAHDSDPTAKRLHQLGFSNAMIEEFFRPFLGGVFLDESLSMPSRMFEFVFRMFASGDIAIPADGMAAIPRQLADKLPRGTVRLNQTVRSIEHSADHSRVALADGSQIEAKTIVVATESNAAARLLQVTELETQWSATTNLYFVAPQSPNTSKMLMLRGDETGPIQSAVVLSDIAPEYASRNRSLISVTVSEAMRDETAESLESAVRQQATNWFGEQAERWECVQTIRVPYGLPKTELEPVVQPVRGGESSLAGIPPHVYVCGDYRETPSIQGAMNSGIRVADQIIKQG